MKTYLLTAAGVIFLSVIVSFIAPEGKLKKSVNFVLRLVCICMLVQPVTKIFNFKTDSAVTVYDYEYVCNVYSQNQSALLTRKVCEELEVDCVCAVEIIYDGNCIKENGVTVEGNFKSFETVEIITEYLRDLGYINITVNEKVG